MGQNIITQTSEYPIWVSYSTTWTSMVKQELLNADMEMHLLSLKDYGFQHRNMFYNIALKWKHTTGSNSFCNYFYNTLAKVRVEKLLRRLQNCQKRKNSFKRQEKKKSVEYWGLDKHSSVGPDGIHPRVPRELAVVLTMPLSNIYQQSCLTEEVSVDWKLVYVMPIYKKGQKGDPGN